MKKLEDMSKDERSLLLFLETRAVDHGGLVDIRHMNKIDLDIAKKWHEEQFLQFSRIRMVDLQKLTSGCTHGIFLTEESWKLAHEERRARQLRLHLKRKWITTHEQIAIKGIAKVRLGIKE